MAARELGSKPSFSYSNYHVIRHSPNCQPKSHLNGSAPDEQTHKHHGADKYLANIYYFITSGKMHYEPCSVIIILLLLGQIIAWITNAVWIDGEDSITLRQPWTIINLAHPRFPSSLPE